MDNYLKVVDGFYSAREEPPKELQTDIDVYDIQDENIKMGVVSEVMDTFNQRMSDNEPWHLQWLLNLNFLASNQYCDIFPDCHDVISLEKFSDHQEREVFNMIAPVYETRLAQLNFVDYSMRARPVTSDQKDAITAALVTKILGAFGRNQDLPSLVRRANAWSESLGTAFYMPVWNPKLGRRLGFMLNGKVFEPIHTGDVETYICSPFEILPDSPWHENIEDCRDFIRYKVYSTEEVYEIWGVWLDGGVRHTFTMNFQSAITPSQVYDSRGSVISRTPVDNSVLVIEKWERPSRNYPKGRLIIVANETLLYHGALPFKNGQYGERSLPLVAQKSIDVPGCFWGKSIVDRAIPIQRRYNAVKNRKQDLLNLITCPPIIVENGSIDEADLTESGLEPGMILNKRRGFSDPHVMEMGQVPAELIQEEQNLINIFTLVTGVSEMSWKSQIPANATSGPMLQIIQEQDQSRLSIPAKNSRKAVLSLAGKWMAYAKSYVSVQRIDMIAGDAAAYETLYWDKSSIEFHDIEYETENAIARSPAQEYQMTVDLAKMGIFIDPETGNMDEYWRSKFLDSLKMGGIWQNAALLIDLQRADAQWNIAMVRKGYMDKVNRSEVDDNKVFIKEYTAYMKSNEYRQLIENNPAIREFMENEIKFHNDEIQRKAQTELQNQLKMQEQQALSQMQVQNQAQQLAAAQNASMQNKNAAQTASNITTVPQPNQAAQPEGSVQPDQTQAAQQMSQLLAQAQ